MKALLCIPVNVHVRKARRIRRIGNPAYNRKGVPHISKRIANLPKNEREEWFKIATRKCSWQQKLAVRRCMDMVDAAHMLKNAKKIMRLQHQLMALVNA